MGFVNEDINTPERIREFDALKLISPVTGKPPERWRWTVDRERGCYLVSLGGGHHEIPYLFSLVVPGGVIRIEGERDAKGQPAKRNVEVEWSITRLYIPRNLASRISELMSLVNEALTSSGSFFNNESVRSVQISLPRPTFF